MPNTSDDEPAQTKRAAHACQPCIARKVKCEQGHPCRTCIAKGTAAECVYQERKPRQLAPQRQVRVLQARVLELERQLARANRQSDEEDDDEAAASGATVPGTTANRAATSTSLSQSASAHRNSSSEGFLSGASSQLSGTSLPPDRMVVDWLYRVFALEVGPVVLLFPQGSLPEDPGEPFRNAAAALAARYLGPPSDSHCKSLANLARRFVEPVVAGKKSPSVEAAQVMLLLANFYAMSADVQELEDAQRMSSVLANTVRELGLADELSVFRASSRTAAAGQSVWDSVDLRRKLFWSSFCLEQDLALTSYRHSTFRESEIAAGLPWTVVLSSAPLTLAALDTGIQPFANSPYARDIFLRYVIRKLIDYSADYHRNNMALGGHHVVPADIVADKHWVLESLRRWITAEIRHVGDGPCPGDDVLITPIRGALASDGLLVPHPMAPKLKATVKTTLFHALSALACSPRVDINGFLNFPDDHRSSFVERLRDWLALANSPTATGASIWAASGQENELTLAALENATTSLSHVISVAQMVQELLPYGSQITFVRPLFVWSILCVATIDLVRLALGNPTESNEAAQRAHVFGLFFQDRSVLQSWPVMSTYSAAYGYFHRQAVSYRNALQMQLHGGVGSMS